MSRTLTVVSLLGALLVTASAAGADPWDLGPFEADPRDLLIAAAAEEAPDDADILVLLSEFVVEVDEEYRRSTRRRLVYRVLTQNGVDWWGEASETWSPWFQEKPRLDARVILKDGTVLRLDQATLDEAPASDSGDIYSDQMTVRAPLPGVAPGAVVEEVRWIEESRPFAEGTAFASHRFGRSQKVHTSRLVFEVPEGFEVNWVARGFELEPRIRTEKGITSWVWEGGPYEKIEWEPGVPRDVTIYPYVSASTGKDWQALARHYEKIVEGRIENADVAPMLADLDPDLSGMALISELVERLHRNVRYTGLEFGEASIIPWEPSDVIERGYGDCKDKASLLVAMLRQSGMDADVVLIRAGGRLDVDPEVPSLSVFDHAIVHVPSENLFIDATAAFSPAGVLPAADQNRSVLIADSGTTGLVKTPVSSSSDNQFHEKRVIELRELGRAAVREITTLTGEWEAQFRSWYDGLAESKLEESLESYLEAEYGAEELSRFERTEARDLTEDFKLVLEADSVENIETGISEATIAIYRNSFVSQVPDLLLSEPGEGDDPRRYDYEIERPTLFTWNYVIGVPPGFEVESLPETEEIELGPARFEGSWNGTEAGVEGMFVLDTVQRRLTPEELAAAQTAFTGFLESDPIVLRFRNVAQTRIEEGDLRGAFEELGRLVEERPESGLIRGRRALGLLAAGLGEAAREEIDMALSLEPESGPLHRLKGWILQHDLLGRLRSPGFDLEGASAAYARAVELDPEDYEALMDHAILLEHDADGKRYSPDADLDAAADLYFSSEEALEAYPSLRPNPYYAMLYAGRFEELEEKLASEAGLLAAKSAILLTSELVRNGADSAEEAIERIVDRAQRDAALGGATQMLMRMRKYPEAAAVIRAAAKGSDSAATLLEQAAVFDRIEIVDTGKWPRTEPESVAWRFVTFIVDEDPERALRELLAPSVREHLEEKDYEETVDVMKRMFGGDAEIPLEVILDLGMSMANITVRDSFDESLHLVELVMMGMAETVPVYAVEDEGEMRAVPGGDESSAAGVQILSYIEEGDLDRARWMLDQERRRIEMVPDDRFGSPALPKLWSEGSDVGVDQMKLAAISTIGESVGEKSDELILEELRTIDRDEIEDPLLYDLILANRLTMAEEWEAVWEALTPILEEAIESDIPYILGMQALGKLGRVEEARELAERRRASDPRDRVWIKGLVDALGEEGGDVSGALDLFRDLAGTSEADARDYNNAAWYAAAAGEAGEEALEWARAAVKMSGGAEPGFINTLSVLHAETGYLREALQLTWQAMNLEGKMEPGAADWLVIGMIAEGLGETDAARDAYRKTIERFEGTETYMTTAAYARRRLDRID